ncbi:MAG: hypothetical protein WCA59_16800 [Candidatus Binataceae bacterium]
MVSGPILAQPLQAPRALGVAQRQLAYRIVPAGRRFVAVAEQSVVSRRRKLALPIWLIIQSKFILIRDN